MSRDINLSFRKKEDLALKQKKIRVFQIISISFFSVTVAITTIIFLLNIFSPVNGLNQEHKSLLAQLSANNKKLGKYIFIKSRLRDVSDILDKRAEYNKIIQSLVVSLPADTNIDTLKISEKKVSITVSAESLSSINTFINSLVALTAKSQIFKHAVMENLVSDSQQGQYNITIQLDTT